MAKTKSKKSVVKGEHYDLLKRLGDNAEPVSEGGWDEEKTDRTVMVTDNELVFKSTFEHESGNGGSHRVESTFQIDGNTFTCLESEDSCTFSPDNEAALQEFVNENTGFQCG